MEKELVGKTIIKAIIKKISEEHDDKPILELEMDDGSIFIIEAGYGDYTGDSEDEYPRFINIKKSK